MPRIDVQALDDWRKVSATPFCESCRAHWRGQPVTVRRPGWLAQAHAGVVARWQGQLEARCEVAHRGLVRVLGYTVPGAWAVYEAERGYSLGRIVRELGSVPRNTALYILTELLAALDVLHDAGLTPHAGIGPDNLWLTAQGEVRLGEVGLWSVPEAAGARMEGAALSTCAPEILRRRQPDVRADLYAVGALLFFALSGRFPFEGQTAAGLLANVDGGVRHRLAALDGGRNGDLDDVVDILLNGDPEGRFAAPRAAFCALGSFGMDAARARSDIGVAVTGLDRRAERSRQGGDVRSVSEAFLGPLPGTTSSLKAVSVQQARFGGAAAGPTPPHGNVLKSSSVSIGVGGQSPEGGEVVRREPRPVRAEPERHPRMELDIVRQEHQQPSPAVAGAVSYVPPPAPVGTPAPEMPARVAPPSTVPPPPTVPPPSIVSPPAAVAPPPAVPTGEGVAHAPPPEVGAAAPAGTPQALSSQRPPSLVAIPQVSSQRPPSFLSLPGAKGSEEPAPLAEPRGSFEPPASVSKNQAPASDLASMALPPRGGASDAPVEKTEILPPGAGAALALPGGKAAASPPAAAAPPSAVPPSAVPPSAAPPSLVDPGKRGGGSLGGPAADGGNPRLATHVQPVAPRLRQGKPWQDPSSTLFRAPAAQHDVTKIRPARARMSLVAVGAIAMLFSCALAVGAVLMLR